MLLLISLFFGRSAPRAWKFFPGLGLLGLVLAQPAPAHHGRDFLMNRSVPVVHRGMWVPHVASSFTQAGGQESLEVEPGLSFMLGQEVAADIHAHFAKEAGERFAEENLGLEAAGFLFGLGNVSLGYLAEYEIGFADHPDAWRLVLLGEHLLSQAVFNVTYRRLRSGADVETAPAPRLHAADGEAAEEPDARVQLSLGYPISLSKGTMLLEGRAVLDGPDTHFLSIGYRSSEEGSAPLWLAGISFGVGHEAPDWQLQASYVYPLFR